MVKRKARQDRRKFKTRPRNVTKQIAERNAEDRRLSEILKKEVSNDTPLD